MVEISTASLEYVRVPVAAKVDGAAHDPTEDTVTMAFLATTAAPASGDWKTASWETDTGPDPDTYYARCLVGTGGAVVLTAGVWHVWVKVADSPETPVKRAGLIRVI
jgi:hypothetical protein